MPKPLLDFTRPVTPSDGFPNLFRGLVFAALAAFIGYLLSHSVNVAIQFDRDAEIRSGRVERIASQTSRRRRGRVSVNYNATVVGRYGTEIVPVDSSVKAGETLRYAYSPSLDALIEAPSPIDRGGFLWLEVRRYQFIVLSGVVLGMLWYSYSQFRLVWIVNTGQYTVNGKPPSEQAG